jgi:CxxC-x17-CxxC domain-containing protein
MIQNCGRYLKSTKIYIKQGDLMEEDKKDRFGRELHKTKCSDCGKETEVPFKPSGDRPVYCRDCYQKHRPRRRF